MPDLDRIDDVFVLDLGDTENRFHPDWLTTVEEHLAVVERAEGPRALVTTATGKFFSNGLDLDWLGGHGDQMAAYVARVQELFARVLALPVVTVAALQGHTFAAGAMLALAHDHRVMRADRGFWCLPEADINIPFTPGMNALIKCKLTPATQTDAMVSARRFGGDDARAAGIVDATASEDEVLSQAVALAAAQAAKDGGVLETIKSRMYADELQVLRDRSVNKFGPA